MALEAHEIEQGWIEETPEAVITSAPSAVDVEEKKEVDYIIRDPLFSPFHVYKCSHAWWADSGKVQKLIDGFKSGLEVKETLVYAGVTRDQWQYFNKMHPEFYAVKEACEAYPIMKALDTVNKGIQTDPKLALAYLRSVYPKFKPKIKVESEEPLAPTSVTNNVAIISTVDTTKIKTLLEGIGKQLIAERTREGIDADGSR